MLADPIFQGLAISLMAGEIASLLISRMAVPVLYFMAHNRASLVESSHRSVLLPCEAHSNSPIEQHQSPASVPMIRGIRLPDAAPIRGKENNRAAPGLTTAGNSSRR